MSHAMPWSKWAYTPKDLQAVDDTLRPSDAATGEEREAQFISLQQAWQSSTDPVHQHFAKMMSSFEPGLFVGGEAADFPADNLDLERWFKRPKGHERRIHGHRHAGVRIVQQGPTLMLALDAHVHHDGPFTVDDLAALRSCPRAGRASSRPSNAARSCARRDPERNALCCSQTLKNGTLTHPSL